MFVVIELQTNSDGTCGNFVWAFETRAEAESKYHSVLAAAAVSTVRVHAAVLLQNDGMCLASKAYTH